MRSIKTYLLSLALMMLCFAEGVIAQQDPQFNQYMFNPLGINPAYAGSRDALSSVLLFRKQWLGFAGSPTISTFAIHGPLIRRKMGLGFQVTSDIIGPRSVTSMEVDYSYRIPFLRGRLSFGLGGGFQYHTFDWNKITYKDQGDIIPTRGVDRLFVPDADFGIWYNTNKSYIGLEVAHLAQPRINILDTSTNGPSLYRQFRHISLTAGHAFILNKDLTLKPSILYKQAGLYKGLMDVNVSLLIKNQFWCGVTARPFYGAILIFEYIHNRKFRVGYSFDYPLNSFKIGARGTSHEIFIGFDLGSGRAASLSPRYF